MTENATVAAGAPVKRQCTRCGQDFHVRLFGPGRTMRYCSRACQQGAYRDRHAAPVEQLRRDVEHALRTLGLRMSAIGVDEIPEDALSAVARQVRALLDVLPESADARGPVTATTVAEPVAVPAPSGCTPRLEPTVSDEPESVAAVKVTVPESVEVLEPQPLFAAPVAPAALVGGLRPTDEQTAIIDACVAGKNLVIEAGAGTGKTSTLRLAALRMPSTRKGVYIAFNRSVAVEAKRKFPSNVLCSTAHGLAFRALGYQYKKRLDAARVPARVAAQIMRITDELELSTSTGRRTLTPAVLAQIAGNTVDRYCHSADIEIGAHHVPKVNGVDGPAKLVLADVVVPFALEMWRELQGTDGRLKFSHDHYLKMWALTEPNLKVDVVLFDEAQDADPVIAKVVQAQQAQLVAVGDSNQAIYGWRGAVDALENWPAEQRLRLTQSWRFGPAIAEEANKWLSALRSKLRLTGTPSVKSCIATLDSPDAILCRTNGEAMGQAMGALDGGKRVALVGGGRSIADMAKAAADLQAGRATQHPELAAFATWAEVQEYVETDESGADLAVFVRLVDDHGPAELIRATERLVGERNADVTISTAHKAKGREWKRVAIGRDFRQPKADEDGKPGPLNRPEAMLAYVSVTRAQHVLDRGGLSWIDDQVSGRPGPVARTPRRITDDDAMVWS